MKFLGLKPVFTYAIGILMVIMMLMGMVACSAEAPIVDEIQTPGSSVTEAPPQPEELAYKVNEDGKTCTITGKGTCTSSNIVIPSTIDGYQVTVIGEFAFTNSSAITSVTIPDSVTTIEKSAFYYNNHLTNVELSDSLTSIGWGAFQGCKGLKNIVIPDSVTCIDLYAFEDCDNLESITVPFTGTGTGASATVGNFGAIFGGSALTQGAYVPESLKTVVITRSVSRMAFQYLENIECVVLPDSITEIPADLFAGCKNLKSVTIPDSVTRIGGSAFSECTSLTSITLPAGLKEIGSLAFYKCRFKSIVIPASLTYMEDRVFSNCRYLNTITFEGTVAQWKAIEIDDAPYQEWNVMTDVTEIICSDGVVKL